MAKALPGSSTLKKDRLNYAFIDSQNLNLGVKDAGWSLDFAKFRLYLRNKYWVGKAYLFIGQVAGQECLYDRLQNMGHHLIFKPTTKYKVGGKTVVKGNVDAELVLYAAAKTVNDYEKAVIVTGDGDFHCLVEYLEEKKKLLALLVPNQRYSQLLGKFLPFVSRVDLLRNSLEYRNFGQRQRSVETLGLSGHGDVTTLPRKTTTVKDDKPSLDKKNPRKDGTLQGRSSTRDTKSVNEKGRKINEE
jgi:uncharacterized LabA/DUF88 family protein